MKQQPEVIELTKKLLKAAGKQNTVTLMNALLVCMALVDQSHYGPRKIPTPNVELRAGQNAQHFGRPA